MKSFKLPPKCTAAHWMHRTAQWRRAQPTWLEPGLGRVEVKDRKLMVFDYMWGPRASEAQDVKHVGNDRCQSQKTRSGLLVGDLKFVFYIFIFRPTRRITSYPRLNQGFGRG